MKVTWHESDWCVKIQKRAQESDRCISDPSPSLGRGLGMRLQIINLYCQLDHTCSISVWLRLVEPSQAGDSITSLSLQQHV